LRHYVENENFCLADYGYRLDEQEQKRRFAVISLLSEEGLQEDLYRARFGTSPLQDFPVIEELGSQGWVQGASPWTLTRDGLEHADSIGPRFFSSRVLEALAQGAAE
jgi:oxygen-independent coproporphyrinogen-3 oxidase